MEFLFDTHAHLNDSRFDEDRESILIQMQAMGMLNLCVGTDLKTSEECIALAEAYDFLYASVGFHPEEAASFSSHCLDQMRTWLAHSKLVALGEIGLDYHYDSPSRELQKAVFQEQLQLASQLGMPVILHIRDAHGDAIELLSKMPNRPRCVVHCSSASWESTKVYLSMDFMISYAGPVTFKNAKKLQECARQVPLDHLLIETDSPYLAPEPVRGTRNTPINVSHICACIAAIRGMDAEELAKQTRANGMRFFGIKEPFQLRSVDSEA